MDIGTLRATLLIDTKSLDAALQRFDVFEKNMSSKAANINKAFSLKADIAPLTDSFQKATQAQTAFATSTKQVGDQAKLTQEQFRKLTESLNPTQTTKFFDAIDAGKSQLEALNVATTKISQSTQQYAKESGLAAEKLSKWNIDSQEASQHEKTMAIAAQAATDAKNSEWNATTKLSAATEADIEVLQRLKAEKTAQLAQSKLLNVDKETQIKAQQKLDAETYKGTTAAYEDFKAQSLRSQGLSMLRKEMDLTTISEQKRKELFTQLQGSTVDQSNAVNFLKQHYSETRGVLDRFNDTIFRYRMSLISLYVFYGVLQKAAKFAWENVNEGAKINEQYTMLDRLAAGYGQTADSIVNSIRKISDETISIAGSIKATAEAFTVGATPKEIESFAIIAKASARSMGLSFEESYERLIKGSVEARQRLLDNIGIVVRWKSAYQEMADQLGITTDDLNSTQMQQARFNAVLEAGKPIVDILTTSYLTQREELDKLSSTVKDIGDSVKTWFADLLLGKEPLTFITDRLSELTSLTGLATKLGLGGAGFVDRYKTEKEALEELLTTYKSGMQVIRESTQLNSDLNSVISQNIKLYNEATKGSKLDEFTKSVQANQVALEGQSVAISQLTLNIESLSSEREKLIQQATKLAAQGFENDREIKSYELLGQQLKETETQLIALTNARDRYTQEYKEGLSRIPAMEQYVADETAKIAEKATKKVESALKKRLSAEKAQLSELSQLRQKALSDYTSILTNVSNIIASGLSLKDIKFDEEIKTWGEATKETSRAYKEFNDDLLSTETSTNKLVSAIRSESEAVSTTRSSYEAYAAELINSNSIQQAYYSNLLSFMQKVGASQKEQIAVQAKAIKSETASLKTRLELWKEFYTKLSSQLDSYTAQIEANARKVIAIEYQKQSMLSSFSEMAWGLRRKGLDVEQQFAGDYILIQEKIRMSDEATGARRTQLLQEAISAVNSFANEWVGKTKEATFSGFDEQPILSAGDAINIIKGLVDKYNNSLDDTKNKTIDSSTEMQKLAQNTSNQMKDVSITISGLVQEISFMSDAYSSFLVAANEEIEVILNSSYVYAEIDNIRDAFQNLKNEMEKQINVTVKTTYTQSGKSSSSNAYPGGWEGDNLPGAYANGGIFPGGYRPAIPMANGGMLFDRPTYLVAEAGTPEAVIPLKNGAVPVKLNSDTGGVKDNRQFVVNYNAPVPAGSKLEEEYKMRRFFNRMASTDARISN